MCLTEENIMENKNTDIIDVEFTEEGKNLPSTEVVRTQVDIEFDYARRNIVHILETSNKVLENTAELVIETDHPKMVEVYSGLIKNLVDANKSLFDIREKKMKIKGELQDQDEVTETTNNITNNAIFVGSTEELLQSIKG